MVIYYSGYRKGIDHLGLLRSLVLSRQPSRVWVGPCTRGGRITSQVRNGGCPTPPSGRLTTLGSLYTLCRGFWWATCEYILYGFPSCFPTVSSTPTSGSLPNQPNSLWHAVFTSALPWGDSASGSSAAPRHRFK